MPDIIVRESVLPVEETPVILLMITIALMHNRAGRLNVKDIKGEDGLG